MKVILVAVLVFAAGCAAGSKPLEKKPIPEIEVLRFENLTFKYNAVQKDMAELQSQFQEMSARICKVTVGVPVEKCVIDWNAKTATQMVDPPKLEAKPVPKASEKK